MKTLKCPLCGNEMQLCSDDVCSGYYVQLYYYDCIGCPLATTPVDSAKEAENQIKDLISRFPPIMRVWPGDKLQVEDGSICEVNQVSTAEVLKLASHEPLFGHRRGKTVFLVFMKSTTPN